MHELARHDLKMTQYVLYKLRDQQSHPLFEGKLIEGYPTGYDPIHSLMCLRGTNFHTLWDLVQVSYFSQLILFHLLYGI